MMALRNRWALTCVVFGVLFIVLIEASKFCEKYKNHPFCKKPWKPKPSAERPPSIDLETNCIADCSDEENENVCGVTSEGEFFAFPNQCEMEKYGCENMKTLTSVDVQFCENPTCLNTGSPVCVRFGFHHYAQLDNECALQLFSCQFSQKFTIVSLDKCERYQPTCTNDLCVDEYALVCGVNREKHYHIFNNDCDLRRHNCVFKATYRPTGIDQCEKNGESCLAICTATDEPVCGQNSKKEVKIFTNVCEFNNYNCAHENQFKLAEMSECQKDCEKLSGTVSCAGQEDVCASNNVELKLFDCKDAMKAFNCKKFRDFKVTSKNKCTCSVKECGANDKQICATTGTKVQEFKNICELNSNSKCGLKQQIVPINNAFCQSESDPLSLENACMHIYYPVCAIGADKVYNWYTSPCELRVTNLQDENDAVIVDNHYCKDQFDPDRCVQHRCGYQYDPVCATDAITNTTQWFGNKCAIDYFNCFYWTKFEVTTLSACKDVVSIDAGGNV